jgi:hypothetical protein
VAFGEAVKSPSDLRFKYPLAPWVHHGLVLAAFFVSGVLLPWWGILVPAILAGGLGSAAGIGRTRAITGALGALSWVVVAFVQDVAAGGRISSRIAALMGLPSSIFIYVLTGALAAMISALGAAIGRLIFVGLSNRAADQE